MTVPNGENAIVEWEKLTRYLLSSEHPIGRHKAIIFERCGYQIEAIDPLIHDLKSVLWTGELATTVESPYGIKYIVDGSLSCADASELHIRTIWIVEQKGAAPRFVTAYPRE